MKKILLHFFLVLAFKWSNGQELPVIDTLKNSPAGKSLQNTNNAPLRDYDHYWKKGSSQITGGWFLMAGGIIVTIIGCGMVAERTTEEIAYAITLNEIPESNKEKTGTTLACVGVAMIAGSIPLLISGYRNKHKARLAPKSQQLSAYLPLTSNKQVHGITLTIPLGNK